MDELWSSRHLGNWTHLLTTLLKRPCAWSVPQGPDSAEGTLPTMNRCRDHIRMPRPGRRMHGRCPSCQESPSGGKKDCFVACASRNDGSQQKGPRKLRGPFRHFDFRDSDLMRSSSFKNSAVSSAIVLGGGLGGKGITSDIGRTSRDASSRGASFLPCNWRVSAAKYSPKKATRRPRPSRFGRIWVNWCRPSWSSCRFQPPSWS